MNKDLHTIFKDAYYTPSHELGASVWNTIVSKQKRKEKYAYYMYTSMGTFSFLSLLFVGKSILSQVSQSGFYEYASLLSSDGGILAVYWKEFTLLLTESLPLTSITLSLFLLFTLAASLRKVAYHYKGHTQLVTV